MSSQIAGTWCLTQAEDDLCTTLSDLAAFQTFTDTLDNSSAAQRIYLGWVPGTIENQDQWTDDEFQAQFPCCIIRPPEDDEEIMIAQDAVGTGWEYILQDVRFALTFERYFPEGLNEQDAYRELRNLVGGIIEGLMAQGGVDTKFAPMSLSPMGPVYVTDYQRRDSLGHLQGWEWLLSYTVNNEGAS